MGEKITQAEDAAAAAQVGERDGPGAPRARNCLVHVVLVT